MGHLFGRRDILKMAGAGTLAFLGLSSLNGCGHSARLKRPNYPVSVINTTQKRGHSIFNYFKAADRTLKTDVAIIGSGIAGLTCAWKLNQAGLNDFLLLELEDQPGGNSRAAQYQGHGPLTLPDRDTSPDIRRAPWAAHYLPLPTRQSTVTIEMLRELGFITGFDAQGDPIYDKAHLCHDPQERLFINGEWVEDLYPILGASQEDLAQTNAFYAEIRRLQLEKDGQGRPAFAIPIAFSSPKYSYLDKISMRSYLDSHGWTSPRLRWHIDYGCRDDYGTTLETTSAWAGLHYFCGRDPKKPGPPGGLLTWPEGNNRLVQGLLDLAGREHLMLNAIVYRINDEKNAVEIYSSDALSGQVTKIEAKRAVCAFHSFLRPMLLNNESLAQRHPEFSYCPWATANITLQAIPDTQQGAPLCWDNVIYRSSSLGYVVADHQDLKWRRNGPATITWYRPYTDSADTRHMRRQLMHRNAESFRQEIVDDLSVPHPDIESLIERIDVMLLGHAMVRPIPNLIWGALLPQMRQSRGHLHFAHSDLSGLSIVEEAQYQGNRAAQEIIKAFRP